MSDVSARRGCERGRVENYILQISEDSARTSFRGDMFLDILFGEDQIVDY